MKSPIETFSEWVKNGKDDGMEKNHYEPVSKIIELINSTENKFNIIDAGCGNGWAVRLVANEKNCKSACGVDGSQLMIQKAKKNDPINNYIHANLNTWNPITKVDVVMSDMAVNTTGIKNIDSIQTGELCIEAMLFAKNLLKSNGFFVSKIFLGGTFNEIVAQGKKYFKEVKVFKPKSSRKDSKESFIICQKIR